MNFEIGKSISTKNPHDLYRLHIQMVDGRMGQPYCDFDVFKGEIIEAAIVERNEEDIAIKMEDIVTIIQKFLKLSWNKQCHTNEAYSFMIFVKEIFPFDEGQCIDENDDSLKKEYDAKIDHIRSLFDDVIGRENDCRDYYNHMKSFYITYFDTEGVEHEVKITGE